MTEIGYFLSSEEHGPRDLVRFAAMGEAAGFESVFISDHYHPWTERQGQSPFVWSVIGAIAATTKQRVTTGVTCPLCDPPGHNHSGCCHLLFAPRGPFCPRCRDGGSAQRAHPGRLLAVCPRTTRDAGGSHWRHARAVAGQLRQSSRALLHGGERSHLFMPGISAPCLYLRLWP